MKSIQIFRDEYDKAKIAYEAKYDKAVLPFPDFLLWVEHKEYEDASFDVEFLNNAFIDFKTAWESGYFQSEEFKSSKYGKAGTMLQSIIEMENIKP